MWLKYWLSNVNSELIVTLTDVKCSGDIQGTSTSTMLIKVGCLMITAGQPREGQEIKTSSTYYLEVD